MADRVVARQLDASNGGDACSVSGNASLRNSLCTTTRTNSNSALSLSGGGSTARNVTAIGAAYGVYMGGTSQVDGTVASGDAQKDLYTLNTGNVLRDSLYVAFDLDLNGNLRRLGSHVDIGAYENVPATPVATEGANTTSTADGNTFAGTVNTGGGRAGGQFLYNGTASPPQSIPASTTATPVTATVAGLGDAPTSYQLKVTTDGGTSTTPAQTAYRAPALTAGEPTAITTTTATLNGTVALRVTRGTEVFETALGTFTTASPPPTGSAAPTATPTATATATATVSPSPGPTAAPAPTPSLRVTSTLKKLVLTVNCGGRPCTAKVRPSVKKGRIAPRLIAAALLGSRTLKPDVSRTLALSYTHRARRALRKLRRAPIAVTVTFTYADGTKVTEKGKVVLNKLLGGLAHGSER